MIDYKLISAGIALLILLGLLTGAAMTVQHWRSEAAKVPGLEQNLKAAQDQIDKERKENERLNGVSKTYQDELRAIRTAAVATPLPPVRLCPKPAQARVLPPAAASGSGTASPASGVVPSGDAADHSEGPDIAPDLDLFAQRCEEVSAQVRGLQKAY